jgi:lipopolysaccharide transport system permease protein
MTAASDVTIHAPETRQRVSLNPIAIAARFWQQRQLLRQLISRAVQARFRGSALGLLWAILNPILMLLVYTFVFGVILQGRWNGQGSTFFFAMNLYCGLIVYGIFSETVGSASTQILSNPSYVKKIIFPLETLPISVLGASLILNLFSLAILLICTQFFIHPLSIHLIALPIVWLPLLCFTAGLSWIVASIGVYVRDVQQIVAILLQILFYLCPIVYPLSRVPDRLIPWYKWVNPVAVSVEQSRRVLLDAEWPQWDWLPANCIVCLLVFIFGYYAFMKTKRGFADVI